MSDNLISRFKSEALDQQVNWLNELLAKLLEANHGLKWAFNAYFKSCKANSWDKGIKKFNLEAWCGGEVNPTLEIVQIGSELKFAMTRYGQLSPLKGGDCNEEEIKKVIMDFFVNPFKYFRGK